MRLVNNLLILLTLAACFSLCNTYVLNLQNERQNTQLQEKYDVSDQKLDEKQLDFLKHEIKNNDNIENYQSQDEIEVSPHQMETFSKSQNFVNIYQRKDGTPQNEKIYQTQKNQIVLSYQKDRAEEEQIQRNYHQPVKGFFTQKQTNVKAIIQIPPRTASQFSATNINKGPYFLSNLYESMINNLILKRNDKNNSNENIPPKTPIQTPKVIAPPPPKIKPVQNQNKTIYLFGRSPLPEAPPIVAGYKEYLSGFKPGLMDVPNEQKVYRETIYRQNIDLINLNNAKIARSFNMGLNIFTDVQANEFDAQFNKLIVPQAVVKQALLAEAQLRDQNGKIKYTIPPQIVIDWSCKAPNAMSQGACGASYAITALQSIEITKKIYNQTNFYPLSIQQVISCGTEEKDLYGCQGGYYQGVFHYVKNYGVGQGFIYHYDYKAKFQGVLSECDKSIMTNKFYLKNKMFIVESKKIKFGDCEQLVKQLRFRAITVGITGNGLQFYIDGTFNSDDNKINHAVTLVGYDSEKGYYIKNSWGNTWGLNGGFGYLGTSTGVCNYAMYPVLTEEIGTPVMCKPQPPLT